MLLRTCDNGCGEGREQHHAGWSLDHDARAGNTRNTAAGLGVLCRQLWVGLCSLHSEAG